MIFAGLIAIAANAQIQITSVGRQGILVLTNTFTNGVCTIEQVSDLTTVWSPLKNVYITSAIAQVTVAPTGAMTFYRAFGVDLSNGAEGFTNFVQSYGLLSTIAGAGGIGDDGVNKWQPEFEGGPATNALLSRPHMAMADRAGNVFIADKDAHAIRKVTPDGLIFTVAGTNGPGNGPDEPTPATEVALSQPNGLWVKADGTLYILDLVNGKIRKRETNGLMETLFEVPGGIIAGRGLWVSEDETLAYVASGSVVKKWTRDEGVTDYATDFVELGNLVVDPWGKLVVTDRFGHRVYRIEEDGTKTVIVGDPNPLDQVRGVWFLPTGAFLLCTHRSSQLLYVDLEGNMYLLMKGYPSGPRAGDGTWFYNLDEYRISECRAITVDFEGNMLLTENDSGFVRKIQFLRLVQP